jgi:hypothetical protein
MARAHKWVPKEQFKDVGGHKGKLHRELGVPVDAPIGAGRIEAATHSRNPEIRRDAIRAQTMAGWHHGGKTRPADRRYGK